MNDAKKRPFAVELYVMREKPSPAKNGNGLYIPPIKMLLTGEWFIVLPTLPSGKLT